MSDTLCIFSVALDSFIYVVCNMAGYVHLQNKEILDKEPWGNRIIYYFKNLVTSENKLKDLVEKYRKNVVPRAINLSSNEKDLNWNLSEVTNLSSKCRY